MLHGCIVIVKLPQTKSTRSKTTELDKYCISMTKAITTTTKFIIPSNSKPRATDCPKINSARALQNTCLGIFKKTVRHLTA